jgi:hypothetical protein
MNETGSTAFADPELSELFDGDPELLAIADAIAATTPRWTGTVVSRPPRTRLLVAAAVLTVAVAAAAPALAFSTTVREFVGLKTASSQPLFVATVTDVVVHGSRPRPGILVTITFTVGQRGKPPGTGIPRKSTFLVLVDGGSPNLTAAHGMNGRYTATVRLAKRRIGGIQIAGLMPKGPKVLNGGFWIPTTIDIPE